MEESNERQRTLCAMFGEALSAYRRQSLEEAIGIFHKAIKIYTEDGPSIFYVKLCEKYRENPPGEMWNDVICLNDK
jgi:adenylate cyclase